MKFRLVTFIIVLFPICSLAKSADKPKLVVGIVIDQMRWDYLYRYNDRYTQGGFKRLMNEGFNCQNTMINYLPSFTAPGHATIYTGAVPAIHGISGNDWIDNQTGQYCYCTGDKRAGIKESDAIGMSPKYLLTTTVTDELRLATNMRSKVFSISLKDRSSIFPAGHTANGAYWFDDTTGNFISSNSYCKKLPDWMEQFNDKNYPDSMLRKKWEPLYPLETYRQSSTDNNAYEGKFFNEAAPIFPHEVRPGGYYRLRFTPFGNNIIFRLATTCIEGESLGQKKETDFLCLSFSATDYAGHKYGPNSVEMEDMFLRFDQELGSFLKYLDDKIGKGNYTVFLTADHGGAHNANYLQDLGIFAGLADEEKLFPLLNGFLKEKFGKDSLVRTLMNYQVYLNEERIMKSSLNRKSIKEAIIAWLLGTDKNEYASQPTSQKIVFRCPVNIAYAVDMEEANYSHVPEPVRTMIVNGYYRQRSGSIQFIPNPGWYSMEVATGTTHGTWNPYDTHIPLLWYGWGIKKGETHRTINITDIAPTISALLRIQMPNGCIGNAITEIVD
jgi:hypothetical protein